MDDLIKRVDAIGACLNGFCACVSDCVDEIKKLPLAHNWIPCSEKLPQYGEAILATITDDRYNNPVIIRHYEPELEEKLLVAWMPLPLPYTEGE